MLHMAYACGLRASELLSMQMTAFPPGSLATVRIQGKGRRERVLPLWRETQQALRGWLGARGTTTEPTLFLNRLGTPLSRDALALMIAKHARQAARYVHLCSRSGSRHMCCGTAAPPIHWRRPVISGRSRYGWGTPLFGAPKSICALIRSRSLRSSPPTPRQV